MRSIISIAAGRNQLPLIRAAAEMGFRVVAVDRAPHPDVRPYLSDCILLSTYNADDVVAACSRLRGQAAAVMARTSGPPVITAAKVAASLGIPGFPLPLAFASESKSVLRQQAQMLNLAVPSGGPVMHSDEVEDSGPWVVKPESPVYGKRNVYLVNTRAELAQAISAAAEESTTKRADCQSYIDGLDVVVGILMAGGQAIFSTLLDEWVCCRDGQFAGLGMVAPSVITSTPLGAALIQASLKAAAAWNMTAGHFFLSFRIQADGTAWLVEANPGLCGDMIADSLLPAAYPDYCPFRAEVMALTEGRPRTPQAPALPAAVIEGQSMEQNKALERLSQPDCAELRRRLSLFSIS